MFLSLSLQNREPSPLNKNCRAGPSLVDHPVEDGRVDEPSGTEEGAGDQVAFKSELLLCSVGGNQWGGGEIKWRVHSGMGPNGAFFFKVH